MTAITTTEISDDEVRAEGHRVGLWLAVSWAEGYLPAEVAGDEDVCRDCDLPLSDMTQRQRDWHMVRKDRVMVGCGGYWMPAFVDALRLYVVRARRGFRWLAGERVQNRTGNTGGTGNMTGTVIADQDPTDRHVHVRWDGDDAGDSAWVWRDNVLPLVERL